MFTIKRNIVHFINKILKSILEIQHQKFPIPLEIYKYLTSKKKIKYIFNKYFILCHTTDMNNAYKDNALLNYWNSRRCLYWHFYAQTSINNEIFNDIYLKYNYLFENKKILDVMSGIGTMWLDKKNNNLTFVETNKYCCKILKNKFTNSKIICGDFKNIETVIHNIDTVVLCGGCLIYLTEKEVNHFFYITRNIKNFIFIKDGVECDDYQFTKYGGNYWNILKRLKEYNINFKEKSSDVKIIKSFSDNKRLFKYFIYIS